MPLMRALWLHYPKDEQAAKTGDEFLWGRDMLIAPVYQKGASNRSVYLPEGDWYDWWTNSKHTGGQKIDRAVDLSIIPVYVRAGAIIPFDPVRQYTAEPVTGPTTLKVFTGANGSFDLYEDDGVSLDYLSGKATLTNITWNDATKTISISPVQTKTFTANIRNRSFRVELIPQGTTKDIQYSGKAIKVVF
jgi:alpha-glucosidase/alpha-D-xyloside xylohydrolase